MQRVLSVLVENESGVLTRIAGLFSRRGFNIESLTVGPTENSAYARMTITVNGSNYAVEQITKQLHKLINVIKITDLTEMSFVDRELALIKVASTATTRSEIIQIADLFRGRIVDVAEDILIVEVTGEQGKINAIVHLLSKFGIKEIARTGRVALSRGVKTDESQVQHRVPLRMVTSS
ncbi:MAG: acetolactate synthase small subunit [Candidatus Melainabacteria bacterium]|nr:acetolactate synthase small subunit [Candidatus Melainabacteria bacterium]